MDFEKALRKGFEETFPESQVRSCLYHLIHNLGKRARKLKLDESNKRYIPPCTSSYYIKIKQNSYSNILLLFSLVDADFVHKIVNGCKNVSLLHYRSIIRVLDRFDAKTDENYSHVLNSKNKAADRGKEEHKRLKNFVKYVRSKQLRIVKVK